MQPCLSRAILGTIARGTLKLNERLRAAIRSLRSRSNETTLPQTCASFFVLRTSVVNSSLPNGGITGRIALSARRTESSDRARITSGSSDQRWMGFGATGSCSRRRVGCSEQNPAPPTLMFVGRPLADHSRNGSRRNDGRNNGDGRKVKRVLKPQSKTRQNQTALSVNCSNPRAGFRLLRRRALRPFFGHGDLAAGDPLGRAL